MQSARHNHGSAVRQVPPLPAYGAAASQQQAALSSLMPPMLSQEEIHRFQQYQQLQFMQQQHSLWQQQQQLSSPFAAQLPYGSLACTVPPPVTLQSAASQQQHASSSSASQRKKHKHKHRQHETQMQSSSTRRGRQQSQQPPPAAAAGSALLEQSAWSSSSFHHPYAQPLRHSGAAAEQASMSPSTAFPTLPGMEDVLPPLPAFEADGGYDRSPAQPLLQSAAEVQKAEQQAALQLQQREEDSSKQEAAVYHQRTPAKEAATADVRGADSERQQNGAAAGPSSIVAALKEQGRRQHDAELRTTGGHLLTAAPSSAVFKPTPLCSLHLALPNSASVSSRAVDFSAASSSFLLTFPFDRLMLEMVGDLTVAPARCVSVSSSQQSQSQAQSQLTLAEVGYIASFLAAEFAARRESSALDAAVQSAMLDLCADVLRDRTADDTAAEQQEEQLQRVMRFLRSFGSTAMTAPLLLSAAMQTLQAFVNTATRHTHAAQTAATAASASSSSFSSSRLSFVSAHVDALVNSFHLCSLMETLLLVPFSASACVLSSSCLSAFRRLYSGSMDAELFDLCPLLCSHLWRIACLVAEAEGGGGRRPLLLDAVRRGRKRQWEEEAKAQEAVEHAEKVRAA